MIHESLSCIQYVFIIRPSYIATINANSLAFKWLMNKSVEAWVCFNDLKIYTDSSHIYCHCLEIQYLLYISLTVPIYLIICSTWPHWKSNLLCMSRWLISENVEVNKADRYTEPSCIKMLPDRMLTGLLHCHGIHVLVPGLFHQLVFPCSYQWHHRYRPLSLHLKLFLWETFLLPFFLYFLQSASCMTTCEHKPRAYKLALKV